MGARSRGAIFVFLLGASLSVTDSQADGHRTDAAATYSGLFGAGSTASGWGTSVGIPFCWVTPDDDCDSNEWSFVVAYSGGLSATHEPPTQEPDVDVQYLLAGARFTWDRDKNTPVKKWDFVPFGHLLVGGVRRREIGSTENFGNWASGGAATLTGGLEFVLYSQSRLNPNGTPRKDPRFDVRLRAQGAVAAYGVGDDARFGAGYAIALSVGWIID